MDLVDKISALRTRPPTYWLNAANQHLPTWTTALLIIAIAWYLTRFVWAVMPQAGEFNWTVSPDAGTTSLLSGSTDSGLNFGSIANAHLFGVAGSEPVGPLTGAVDAPETRLNLKLRGTVAADDPEVAHAIIGEGGKGNDKVYFINDKLPGGASLHEVHVDRIILNRSGTLEALRLPKLSTALGNQSSSARNTSAGASGRSSTRQPIQEALNRSGATSFTDILRPQPYMPNGVLTGYRIYPGRDRRKFAALGLRPGDLVTAINGQPLNNLQNGMEVFKSLGSASELSLAIERSGAPVMVTIDSSQLSSSTGNE